MPNILISGSSKRIGRHLALSFASAGWGVAVHFNQSREAAEQTYNEVKSLGVSAALVQADICSQEQVGIAFAKAWDVLGGLDVLINNAGIFPEKKDFVDIDKSLLDLVIDTNLRGAFNFSQEFAKHTKEEARSKNFRIINIASVGGVETWKGRLPYNVSKAGLIQLTKSMARDMAPRFTVNCVAPGIISFPDESPEESLIVPENKIPMNRYGSGDDIYDAVRFFAEASSYITGQILLVDGGYHISSR